MAAYAADTTIAAARPPTTPKAEGAICIILAAGFSQVERDIALADDAELANLVGVPKALLPVAGKPMLDYWWEYLSQQRTISEIFVVTNALAYKQFERWATGRGVAMDRIVNSGATCAERSRGVLRDVELGLRKAQQSLGASAEGRDLVVFAGDTLFFKDFDLDRILDFHRCKGGSLCLYYGKTESDRPSERGMCQVDGSTSQVTSFAEKPKPGQRGHDFSYVSPLFYILESGAWGQVPRFNKARQGAARVSGGSAFSFGCFVEHAVEDLRLPFWGMRMPGAFHMIGASTGLEEYRDLDRFFKGLSPGGCGGGRRVRTKSYARVGLIGNPSDGFHGKTLAVTIQNFWATVEMWESERLTLLPHPLYDPSSFSGLADLHFIGRREGYYGGSRLLMATCKKFQELCTVNGVALPRKNFTVRYDTNIPRQVGLAGSSAIVNALFQALMQFYNLSSQHIPLEKQPSFILSVESELGIQAGLQDRVVQVYQGLVFMDFDQAFMAEHGHGRYERLPRHAFEWLASLPLFIAYESDPSDSGKIHSNVRARWDAKEPAVLEAMQHFAELTVRARAAVEGHDQAAFCDLMDENFATRRRIYGDACLGRKNLQMVEICQKAGAAAKFPGSGGAVLGLCRASGTEAAEDAMERIREAIEAEGFVFCPLDPVMPESRK